MKQRNLSLIVLLFFLTLLVPSNSAFGSKPFFSIFSKNKDSEQQPNIDKLLNDFFVVDEVKEPIHLVLVNKKKQQLQVLEHDGTLKVVAQFTSATGENSGRKLISGDSRTPEGIYFITREFKDNKITIFGNRAFHLDYPNIYDKAVGRNGDGIYIHGTNKELKPNSTNGCITMRNNDLDMLEKYLGKAITPVVIVEDFNFLQRDIASNPTGNDFSTAKKLLLPDSIDPDKVTFDHLYMLNDGNKTVAVGEYVYRQHNYTRMRGYSRSYLEYVTGQGWQTRKQILQTTPVQIFPKYPIKVVMHKPVTHSIEMIASAPPLQKQTVVAAVREQSTAKIQPLREPPVKIEAPPVPAPTPKPIIKPAPELAPKPLPVPPPAPTPPIVKPLKEIQPKPEPTKLDVRAEQSTSDEVNKIESTESSPKANIEPPNKVKITYGYPRDKQIVVNFIKKWRLAWQSKDIDTYIGSYDSSFKQGKKDLKAWKTHKERLNKKYATISVTVSDIKISWSKKGATASFDQVYKSDKYNAVGRKTLHLVYKDDSWGIRRELWAQRR